VTRAENNESDIKIDPPVVGVHSSAEPAASSEAVAGTLLGLKPERQDAFAERIRALRALRNKGYGRSCARRTKRLKLSGAPPCENQAR